MSLVNLSAAPLRRSSMARHDTGGRRLTGLARPARIVAGGMPRQRRCGQFFARAARPRSGAPVV
jgi:hypothetical protein